MPDFNGEEQANHHGAEEPLARAARADSRDHRIEQPDSAELQCPCFSEPSSLQEQENQIPGEYIACGEECFAKTPPGRASGPGRWEEQPCEERRVAVGVSSVGRVAARDVSRGIGEDVVVDVGVFES